jgi:hypothetical protein
MILLSLLFTLMIYEYTMGNKIQGMTLGFVNEECKISNFTKIIGSNISCEYLREFIKLDRAQLLQFDYFSEAFNRFRRGHLDGVLVFPSNSSNSIMEWFKDMGSKTGNFLDIYLDHSDVRKYLCLSFGLKFAFSNFSDRVFQEHMQVSRLYYPINIEPVFSSIEGDYKENVFPSFLIA